jgi:hypothetical protein
MLRFILHSALFLAGTSKCFGVSGSPITLHVDVLDTQVCRQLSGSLTVLVDLRLHFTNRSTTPVILPRLWEDSRAILKEPSGGGDVLADIRTPPDRNLNIKRMNIDRPEPPYFVVLPPGQSYDGFDILVLVPLATKEAAKFEKERADCAFQVEVRSVLVFDSDSLKSLQANWSAVGKLVAQPIAAAPVTIHPWDSEGAVHCDTRITLGHGRRPGTDIKPE